MTAANIQSCSDMSNVSSVPSVVSYEDWLSILDLIGPFGELLEQQELLDQCPDCSRVEARQLAGLIDGREGLPASMKDDQEYMTGWEFVREKGRW